MRINSFFWKVFAAQAAKKHLPACLLIFEKNQQTGGVKIYQAEASNLSHHNFFNNREVAISTAVHKANCP